MENPKYADLPGIARDQPDVYETNDLPEAEQGNLSMADAIVDRCDSVETLKVTPNEAYDKFKGKSLDSRNVDFTDNIGNRKKKGYDVRSGDWEMVGNRTEETENPIQAYNRIQFEIKQLFEQMNEIMKSSEKQKELSLSPVTLVQQIQQLEKELQDLHMEKVLGSEALKEMSDPLGTLHKNLLTQLEGFKTSALSEKKPKSSKPVAAAATSTTDGIKYELYVRPEQAKLEQASKLASLEQRLRCLENAVGQDKKKMVFLTSNTDGKNINAAINVLSSKLNLLDSSYLDQIESRLTSVQQVMQQVSEKKQQIETADQQSKISGLYELAKKVESLSTGLPDIVERLISLKDLHEQALQFSKALTQLDTKQQSIIATLQTNEKVLKEAQTTFSKNMDMIEANVNSLNARISALK